MADLGIESIIVDLVGIRGIGGGGLTTTGSGGGGLMTTGSGGGGLMTTGSGGGGGGGGGTDEVSGGAPGGAVGKFAAAFFTSLLADFSATDAFSTG